MSCVTKEIWKERPNGSPAVNSLFALSDQMNENEELLEPKTVARILNCTPEEVIQLARSGELKATRMGKHWRFRRADVTAYKGHEERSD